MFFRANFKLEYFSMEEVKRFVHFWTEYITVMKQKKRNKTMIQRFIKKKHAYDIFFSDRKSQTTV